jgi:hypothetical protein
LPQHPAVQPHLDARVGAFVFEQLDNRLRAVVTEELPVFPLVPRDAVSLDQREEILRRAAREGGLQEVGAAARDVVRGCGPEVGEIAPSAAGDENLVSEPRLVFEHENAPSAPAGRLSAEQPRGAPANDDGIVIQPALPFRKRIGMASHESARSGRRANRYRAVFNASMVASGVWRSWQRSRNSDPPSRVSRKARFRIGCKIACEILAKSADWAGGSGPRRSWFPRTSDTTVSLGESRVRLA